MVRRLSSARSILDADLVGIQLEIEPVGDCRLPSNYTYFLHAWFLDEMRRISPELSQVLHDNQEEKAFTLSGFLGEGEVGDRVVLFRAGRRFCCVVTGLQSRVCRVLGDRKSVV